MTSVTASDGDSSWLKKRSGVFNTSPNNSITAPNSTTVATKVVDKELERLKTRGAVSSVWSNKFVQNDTTSGTTSPPGHSQKLNARRPLSNNKDFSSNLNAALLQEKNSRNSTSSLDLDSKRNSEVSCDDSLWSHYESLKSQYAQVNSRLTLANKEIAMYKEQEDKNESQVIQMRELAEIIVKQHILLGEYEVSLDHLRNSTHDHDMARSELSALRKELSSLYEMKDDMEKTIGSLKADLETSYSQIRLMMAVSTEVQTEFESYRKQASAEISELLKDQSVGYEITTSSSEFETLRLEIKKLNLAIQERDRKSKAVETEHGQTLEKMHLQELELQQLKAEVKSSNRASFRNSGENIVKFLQNQIQELNRSLDHKDQIINKLENQIKTQRTSMDSQMIGLTQDILEKDALLLELMGSCGNSRVGSMISPIMDNIDLDTPDQNKDTSLYYRRQNEAKRQMSQVRDYMYAASSDEENFDNQDYSSDEEYNHPQKVSHSERGPQSPEDTTSSYISFDSSDEEQEQVAEIKHFSYTSVLSQSSVSIKNRNSLIQMERNSESKRNSDSLSPFGKENGIVGGSVWPIPPPTPPPSEPLPPLPVFSDQAQSEITPKPPRRGRSKTTIREDLPTIYTKSIHKTADLPRIVPLQKSPVDTRKDIKRSPLDSSHLSTNSTSWMDDPESEEEEHWSEALSH